MTEQADRDKLAEWIDQASVECYGHKCVTAEAARQIAIAYADRRVAEAYESAAKCFEVYSSDQIGSIEHRWVTKPKDIAECRTKAATWNDAASELRRALSPAREGGTGDE